MAHTIEAGVTLTFPKLNGLNYRQSKRDIIMLLLDRGFFGFIDDNEPVLDSETATAKDCRVYQLKKSKAL